MINATGGPLSKKGCPACAASFAPNQHNTGTRTHMHLRFSIGGFEFVGLVWSSLPHTGTSVQENS
jgi:hypothetical protein